jgi:hypothetical protein
MDLGSVEDWVRIGEGNANVVFAYRGHQSHPVGVFSPTVLCHGGVLNVICAPWFGLLLFDLTWGLLFRLARCFVSRRRSTMWSRRLRKPLSSEFGRPYRVAVLYQVDVPSFLQSCFEPAPVLEAPPGVLAPLLTPGHALQMRLCGRRPSNASWHTSSAPST